MATSKERLIKNLQDVGFTVTTEQGEKHPHLIIANSTTTLKANVHRGTLSIFNAEGTGVLEACLLVLPCLTKTDNGIAISRSVCRQMKSVNTFLMERRSTPATKVKRFASALRTKLAERRLLKCQLRK